MFSLSDYDYKLPDELIAQTASHPPESAKLLFFDKKNNIQQDRVFSELPSVLDPETLIIFNNSKVVKARIFFPEWNGELLFLQALDTYTFQSLVRPGKKRKLWSEHPIPGTNIIFSVLDTTEEWRILRCSHPIFEILEHYGHMPLPPYISYDASKDVDYQAVIADERKQWSVAAPTASLHFSESLIHDIQKTGHSVAFVTLHVGLWTFKSVDVETIQDYHIHKEQCEVDHTIFKLLAQQKQEHKKILAIGTTSTRTLESLPYLRALLSDEQKQTITDSETIHYRNMIIQWITIEQSNTYITGIIFHDALLVFNSTLYIYPWFQFRIIDELITNFHLPKSSLLMLVAWFIWYDSMKVLYEHAIQKLYRFFSFWDAMYLKK